MSECKKKDKFKHSQVLRSKAVSSAETKTPTWGVSLVYTCQVFPSHWHEILDFYSAITDLIWIFSQSLFLSSLFADFANVFAYCVVFWFDFAHFDKVK